MDYLVGDREVFQEVHLSHFWCDIYKTYHFKNSLVTIFLLSVLDHHLISLEPSYPDTMKPIALSNTYSLPVRI